jgi:hypothetical protein
VLDVLDVFSFEGLVGDAAGRSQLERQAGDE